MSDLAVLPPLAADHPAYEALKRAFAVLAETDADLPEAALAFAAAGARPEVLLRLGQIGKDAFDLLGQPGRIYYVFNTSGVQQTRIKAAKQGMQARRDFYRLADAESDFASAALARVARLLEACDGGQNLERPDNGVAAWLQYLANDLVWVTLREKGKLPDGKDAQQAKVDPLRLLWRAARAEGLDDLEVAALAFERKDWQEWREDRFRPLLESVSLPELLDALGEARWGELLARLSSSGRVTLVAYLGDPRRNDRRRYGGLLMRLVVDGSKTVRTQAQKYLDRVDPTQRREALTRVLQEGAPAEREQAVAMLGQVADPESLALLEAQRERETSKPVLLAIQHALGKQSAMENARELEAPPLEVDESLLGGELGESALAILRDSRLALRVRYEQAAQNEIEANAKSQSNYKSNWAQKSWKDYEKFGEDQLDKLLKMLNGETKRQSLQGNPQATLQQSLALVDLPEFGLLHLTRWIANEHYGMYRWWNHPATQRWIAKVGADKVDLRLFAQHFKTAGGSLDDIVRPCLYQYWETEASPLDRLPADRVWPFFVEQPQFLAQSLGLIPPSKENSYYSSQYLGRGLMLLGLFPSLPPKLIPTLFDLALGEAKTHRPAAQRLLLQLPDLLRQVVAALASSKQELRASAALWLADIGDAAAIEPLLAALKKESREAPRAAMLTALERLGVDIAPFTAPELLLAEAQKGFKAKLPAGLTWFPFGRIPALRWRDGGEVPADVPRWWVILACKLKEPGNNALLTRYLSLLDAPSRAELGSLVLHSFIHQDTRGPTVEEALAKAEKEAPSRFSMYQNWSKHAGYEHYGQRTLEQVVEELKQENLATYLGSAIGEKGVLALAAGIPGHEAVSLLQIYMRDHYRRRAQIEAMLEALGGSDDPALIQLLLAVSRRHRTASVQEKAKVLVEQVATRNGWSQDQLADRTVPTAGFDEKGVLALEYGERRFTVTLDADLKPVLANPEGKVVKALPEARKQDDPEQIKEAKSQFSTCKKELKQVLELQTARLYDAMCAGREWPVAEWREYLLGHPIVGRLVQRLVWLYDDGETTRAFRPTEDGSLIDVEDDEVELGEGGTLKLAHAALLEADAVKAWQKHFKDYKQKPLFAQLTRALPIIADTKATVIEDRIGWVSDAFTLRGHFNKLNYLRGEAMDGGFFHEYRKPFPAANIQAVIEFSGNCLPEENVAAALKGLYFHHLNDRSYNPKSLPLKQVPAVLLAEVYADYHQLAEACAGFDPAWESKMPW